MNAPIIQLIGPTATGKTELALALANIFPLEIVSVDSALVYQEMDIGTAKPTLKERQKIKHHLIDICMPNESYSVGLFLRDVTESIKDIHQRKKIPLLVGGTMLYFNALNKGLAEIPTIPEEVRQTLQKILAEKGLDFLYTQLKMEDPTTAERLHPHDSQRILRSLEVFIATKKPLSQWHIEQKNISQNQNFSHALSLVLIPQDREKLHKIIAQRFKQMLANGFVNEVDYLQKKYVLSVDSPSMRCIGYRQVLRYLQQQITQQEMLEQGIFATRQLAKRQITWLRNWPKDKWVPPHQSDTIQPLKNHIDNYLQSFR